MGKRLAVGNLPHDADEDAIRVAFSAAGNVERVHIPLDRETQRPRGFAFVEMASDAEAKQALEAMNGFTMGTRTLWVSEAEIVGRRGRAVGLAAWSRWSAAAARRAIAASGRTAVRVPSAATAVAVATGWCGGGGGGWPGGGGGGGGGDSAEDRANRFSVLTPSRDDNGIASATARARVVITAAAVTTKAIGTTSSAAAGGVASR
ncbi:MAG: RNA-binding protein [Planctomycetota bacterium]